MPTSKSKLPNSIVMPYNWLVHRILHEAVSEAATKYAHGRLVDIGCGRKPWREVFAPHVDEYIGVDHANTQHDIQFADVVADAYDTTLPDGAADTVVSLAVLEHLEEPGAAIIEMARLLKPGGRLILTAPMFWHEHEAPRDFYRYTQYGLRHLIERAQLEVV
ncbi:MAG: class I SAM-dependent methyltransferase, partial [Planctomycetales bacterium]|nr:class I SAM-dependent methyltransferase [Planctomycetales bacterium]